MSPKIDYVFKRIFGYVGNEVATKGLLSAILKTEISEIELNQSTIMEKDLFDDKIGILDIRAKLNNEINCDIEMQIVDRKNIEKRILYYWSKLYVQEIKHGIDYINLRKTIVVLFSDYELESLKKVKKCILDQKAIEDAGYDKGVKFGIEVGIKEGKEKGIKAEKIETAQKLLRHNVELNIILEVTGLKKEEIEKLM